MQPCGSTPLRPPRPARVILTDVSVSRLRPWMHLPRSPGITVRRPASPWQLTDPLTSRNRSARHLDIRIEPSTDVPKGRRAEITARLSYRAPARAGAGIRPVDLRRRDDSTNKLQFNGDPQSRTHIALTGIGDQSSH